MQRLLCHFTRRRLGAYRDGELGPRVRARTARHVGRCTGCATELTRLVDLHDALVATTVPEPEWDVLWPRVQARLRAEPERDFAPVRPPRPRWVTALADPRWAVGSAVAAAAVLTLAVFGAWQQPGGRSGRPVGVARGVLPAESLSRLVQQVVVQAVETGDPASSVMVFTHPASDDTVVWVFGLEPTEI